MFNKMVKVEFAAHKNIETSFNEIGVYANHSHSYDIQFTRGSNNGSGLSYPAAYYVYQLYTGLGDETYLHFTRKLFKCLQTFFIQEKRIDILINGEMITITNTMDIELMTFEVFNKIRNEGKE